MNPSRPLAFLRRIPAPLLVLLVAGSTLPAQERADPISVGMGRSTVGSARGVSALYTNIGALSLPALGDDNGARGVELDIALAPVGISAGSTYLNTDELNFVFDDKACDVFSDADRLRLGGLLERDRLAADVAVDLAALRLSIPGIGALGVQYGHRIRVRMNFSEEFRRDVLGTGDIFARSSEYGGTDVGGEWMKRLAVTLATAWQRVDPKDSGDVWLPTVGFGASVSALEGIVHFDVDRASSVSTVALQPGASGERRLAVDGFYAFRSSVPQDFEPAQAVLRPGFGGSDSTRALGWGGSVGFSAVVLRRTHVIDDFAVGSPLDPESNRSHTVISRDAITFGATVDEIGSLLWEGMNLRRSRTIDTVVTDDRGGLTYEVLCGYRGDLDTVGSFRSFLPSQLRVGGAVDITAFVPSIRGDLMASVEAAFDLNDAIGREGAARFSAGAQWRPWRILTLYSGMQLGGRQGFAWSLGANVQPLKWLSIAAATSDWTGVLSGGALQYDLTLRLATHFRF